MTRILSDEQIEDLAELSKVASSFDVKIGIIGAVALGSMLGTLGRFTADVDLVIALDWVDFEAFAVALSQKGWKRKPRREHRWRSARGSLADILPAGPKLCRAKQLTWPERQLTMSLVGFDHVFAHAVSIEFAPRAHFLVAPLAVLAILKIVAFLDDPYRRAKDLVDLQLLLAKYENESDRIFSDDVFAAELEDIDQASAFLLGLDVGRIATGEDRAVIGKFLQRCQDDERRPERFQLHLRAFEKGIS